MAAVTSPQPLAEGEAIQKNIENQSQQNPKQTYASQIVKKNSAANPIELCPVTFDHGEPTVEFTVEEVNQFTREEGLHQAVIVKFSYGKPELQEFRKIFAKQFDVKGYCNIGQLEFRHLLVRFDSFEDYVQFVSKTTGYIKSKGDEFFFRTFPWTLGFNPREETSKAVVWISFPDLPPNFFAKKSLMSIASAVGKPLTVDKATQDRTRPSAARVKVLLDLLDKHPKKVKIHIVDKVSGKSVEFYQMVVYDNLPKYCTCCNHQGHAEATCRWKIDESQDDVVDTTEEMDSTDKRKGNARNYLTEKTNNQQNGDVANSSLDRAVENTADDRAIPKDRAAEMNVHSHVVQGVKNSKSGHWSVVNRAVKGHGELDGKYAKEDGNNAHVQHMGITEIAEKDQLLSKQNENMADALVQNQSQSTIDALDGQKATAGGQLERANKNIVDGGHGNMERNKATAEKAVPVGQYEDTGMVAVSNTCNAQEKLAEIVVPAGHLNFNNGHSINKIVGGGSNGQKAGHDAKDVKTIAAKAAEGRGKADSMRQYREKEKGHLPHVGSTEKAKHPMSINNNKSDNAYMNHVGSCTDVCAPKGNENNVSVEKVVDQVEKESVAGHECLNCEGSIIGQVTFQHADSFQSAEHSNGSVGGHVKADGNARSNIEILSDLDGKQKTQGGHATPVSPHDRIKADHITVVTHAGVEAVVRESGDQIGGEVKENVNLVTSRKSPTRKQVPLKLQNCSVRRIDGNVDSSPNSFEALAIDGDPEVEATGLQDSGMSKQLVLRSKQIVPCPSSGKEDQSSENFALDVDVRQQASKKNGGAELMGSHSSNVQTLHFSSPHVEQIIKEAQIAMMMHTNMFQQPMVTLNKSVFDVPSQSVDSFGEPGQSTGNNDAFIKGNIRELVINSKLWDQQREEDEEEDYGDGFAGYESEEFEQEVDQDSAGEDLDAPINPKLHGKYAASTSTICYAAAENSKRYLNHNAPAFVPRTSANAEAAGLVQKDTGISVQQHQCSGAKTDPGQQQANANTTGIVAMVADIPDISLEDRKLLDALVSSTSISCANSPHGASTGRVTRTNSKNKNEAVLVNKEDRSSLVPQDLPHEIPQTVNLGRDIYEEGEEDSILQ